LGPWVVKGVIFCNSWFLKQVFPINLHTLPFKASRQGVSGLFVVLPLVTLKLVYPYPSYFVFDFFFLDFWSIKLFYSHYFSVSFSRIIDFLVEYIILCSYIYCISSGKFSNLLRSWTCLHCWLLQTWDSFNSGQSSVNVRIRWLTICLALINMI